MGAHVLPPCGKFIVDEGKRDDPILMGWEYEIDTKMTEEKTNLIKQTLPDHYAWAYEYLDYDTNGYEIKSSVATLRKLKLEIKQIKSLFDLTSKNAYKSSGGIHTNISTNKYTRKYYLKVFEFLHNIKYFDLFHKLSGRTKTNIQKWARQEENKDWWGDHCAIISMRKSYAYEMRIFGAQPDLLIPALEFSHALFNLSPEIVGDITPDSLYKHTTKYHRYNHIKELMDNCL